MFYEYISSWDNYNEIPLAPKENFFSNLEKNGISDRDYKHAQKVYRLVVEIAYLIYIKALYKS